VTSSLAPLATLDELHPPGVALAARTRAEAFAWVTQSGDSVDSVPGLPLAVAGSLPLLAHPSATHPAAIRLLRAAGLALPQAARPYDGEAGARRVMAAWIAAGYRLAGIYPLPRDWLPEAAHLVPPALLARLNSKAHLADLVPPGLRPERQVLPRAELAAALEIYPGEAVVLKIATAIGNGAGTDVMICRSPAERAEALAALASEQRPFDGVVVERLEDFADLWCAGFAVLDERVRWLGASRHRLNERGLQSGNLLGAGAALPEAGRRAIEALAARAGELGFRGVAGCDLGRTRDGRLLIFDLNFRLNASTAMLLLQPAAAARSGLPAAINCLFATAAAPLEMARLLLPWVEAGRLVPTRVLDHRLLPSRTARTSLTGFLLGRDEADCLALESLVARTLA